MKSTIAFLVAMFTIGFIEAQTTNPNYNGSLAKSLQAGDYGMKQYVLVLLKTGENKQQQKKNLSMSGTARQL